MRWHSVMLCHSLLLSTTAYGLYSRSLRSARSSRGGTALVERFRCGGGGGGGPAYHYLLLY